MYAAAYDSPIGRLFLAADETGVCQIRLMRSEDEVCLAKSCELLEQAALELDAYFAGERQHFSFDVSMQGTAFERAVWDALVHIPYGETRSYGQLAAQLGCPKGARAVGNACRRNPLLIAVPCHRVVAASGALTGFSAGMEAKRALLELESRADGKMAAIK